MSADAFRSLLKAALAKDVPYSVRAKASGEAFAAVLALFGDSKGGISLLVTRRTERLEKHGGQMAFPGGVRDEADQEVASVTALRETEEEVGIPPSAVEVFGQLPELSTMTGYRVSPVIGWLRARVDDTPLRPNPAEIDRCLWIPLQRFAEPGVYRTEWIELGSVRYPMHVYLVDGYRIWGATGAMVKNLLDRLGSLG